MRLQNLATAALLACAVVRLSTGVRAIERDGREAYCREESDFHVERGDALLAGVPLPGVARAMPFYSVANAVLCDHLSLPAANAVRAAVFSTTAVLVFALGALLYSSASGAGAALQYACVAPVGGDERWLYTLTVLLAACFLVLRARSPSPAASARLGAGLGASFLVLSPLFLLPFALILYEWARTRKAPARAAAAALCLIPLLFLIPWVVMNWRLSGRFVLFEDGRAENNVIMGALGRVRTLGSGDYRAAAGLSAAQNVYVWAAKEILLHPARYLGAVAARLRLVAGLHPLLLLAAALSVRLGRGREECRQFALLAAYFVAIHCLMPVQDNYFAPAWPLFAVLASGLLAPLTRPSSEKTKAACAAAAAAVLAVVLAAQAGALGLAWTYPERSAQPRALTRALDRYPRDPWLWSERGMELLRQGRAEEAAAALARALALDPQEDRKVRYAWALLAAGGPDARLWEDLIPREDGALIGVRARVLRAVYFALNGKRTPAIASLESARALELSSRAAASSLPRIVLEIASAWPAARRAAVVDFFLSVPNFTDMLGSDAAAKADALLGLAAAAERGAALRCLALAEGLPLDPESARGVSAAYRDLGLWERALAVLKRSAPRGPDDARRFADLALMAALAKRPRQAREILGAAEDLSGRRDDAFLSLVRAEISAAGGERGSSAGAGGLDDDGARRLFMIYQGAGEYRRALQIADLRVRARPDDARWRNDRGVARALLGDGEGAAADLRESIALDPDLLEAYLSLGSLYASARRRAEALELYQRALSRAGTKDDEGVVRRIISERAKLSP